MMSKLGRFFQTPSRVWRGAGSLEELTDLVTSQLDKDAERRFFSLAPEEQTALCTAFEGLVAALHYARPGDEVSAAHQTHHLGYDHLLVEELAVDQPTLQRAQATLRESNPDSFYLRQLDS